MTGSAHCALAPYWFDKIKSCTEEGAQKLSSLTGYQASVRGGVVQVKMNDDGERVHLSGFCITVIKSKILV